MTFNIIKTRPPTAGTLRVPKPVVVSPRGLAGQEIQAKWNALHGAPGAPKVPSDTGIVPSEGGFYREYARGYIIHHDKLGTYWVQGAIAGHYVSLGGTGARIGFPVSDEEDFFGGRATRFEFGMICWWPDTGAIDVGDVAVTYTGFICFGETDEWSASDEPYVMFGTVPAVSSLGRAVRTQIYGGVDSGEGVADAIELYRGPPFGLSLTAILMEHDLSDPDKYLETVKAGVDKACSVIGMGINAVPYVGAFIAPVVESLLKAVAPDAAEWINDEIIGGKDDHIGTVTMTLSPKDMVRLLKVNAVVSHGVTWQLDSPLITDGDASYKVYLTVTRV